MVSVPLRSDLPVLRGFQIHHSDEIGLLRLSIRPPSGNFNMENAEFTILYTLRLEAEFTVVGGMEGTDGV